jgi:hypothetical protein
MSQAESDQQITVTAEERAHPAVRKLARAAILVARQQLSDEQATTAETGMAKPAAPSTPEEASGQEVSHD